MEDTTSIEEQKREEEAPSESSDRVPDPDFEPMKPSRRGTQQESEESNLRSRRVASQLLRAKASMLEDRMKSPFFPTLNASSSSSRPIRPMAIPIPLQQFPPQPPPASYTENMDPQMAAKHILQNALKREAFLSSQQPQEQRPPMMFMEPRVIQIYQLMTKIVIVGGIVLGAYATYRLGSYVLNKMMSSDDSKSLPQSSDADITLNE